MTDKKAPLREGYQPSKTDDSLKYGYQPEEPSHRNGYQPPVSDGDSPANEPAPPSEE